MPKQEIGILNRGDKVTFFVNHRRRMKGITGTVNGVRGEVVTVRSGWMIYSILLSNCQRVENP